MYISYNLETNVIIKVYGTVPRRPRHLDERFHPALSPECLAAVGYTLCTSDKQSKTGYMYTVQVYYYVESQECGHNV